MAKAFDTVPHTNLIAKMRSLNVSHYLTDWIENYLRRRQQRVVIRNVKSLNLEVHIGVPQGSVIGLILFLIYISDMYTHRSIESKICIFADDTKLSNKVGSDEGVKSIKRDLARLEEWTKRNGMKFNVEKCGVRHCGAKNPKTHYELCGVPMRAT